MNERNFYEENKPVDTGVKIEISGEEFFSYEQNQKDVNEFLNDNVSPVHIIGRFNGSWDGELDDAVKTATKVRYANRTDHKDYLYEVYDFSKFPKLAIMPLKLGFVKNKYKAQIQLQRPGCLMPRHRDPETIFSVYNEDKNRCIRVLIALAPWEYGQLMFFNNQIMIGWNKGDIIYCDFLKTWHFTANCSYHSRPLLQVTGVANDNLLDQVYSKKFNLIHV